MLTCISYCNAVEVQVHTVTCFREENSKLEEETRDNGSSPIEMFYLRCFAITKKTASFRITRPNFLCVPALSVHVNHLLDIIQQNTVLLRQSGAIYFCNEALIGLSTSACLQNPTHRCSNLCSYESDTGAEA